jgi:predicted PurR-regulated permease PerM
MTITRLPFIVKLALSLFSIVALTYILWIGQAILAPLFLALLVAFLFVPFADFLEKKLRFRRSFSSIFSVIIVLIILGLLGRFFSSQLADFSNDIPLLEYQFNKTTDTIQEWVNQTFHIDSDKQFEYIDLGIDKLLSSSGEILSFTLSFFTSGLAFFVFFIFFFIFILNYRRLLNSFIINVFSNEHKDKVREVVGEVRRMTKSYMLGLCIQVTLVAVLTSSSLGVLGVKYALLLGVLTGLLNVIPYIGMITSLLFASFIAFATSGPIMSLYVVIAYAAVHLIDANIILPFVVGSKVKINALFSFLGILIGEHLWGISGMLLCIPALAILKIIFSHVDSLKPWSLLMGEASSSKRAKRKIKITKKITFEEKD